MDGETATYADYFRQGQPVKVCIHLADKRMFEDNAVVMAMEANRMKLEVWGSDLADMGGAKAGADATVITEHGYSVYRCHASLETETSGRIVSLLLTGGVRERQLREYFRFDVFVPLIHSIPENQALTVVKAQWRENIERCLEIPPPVIGWHGDGFRVVKWNGLVNLHPVRVNLSGGGIRFRTPEYAAPGTLMHLTIFLPLLQPRVISVVAEVMRCHEMTLFWTKGNFHSAALRFLFIEERDRDSIISHIFMEQRRSLQAMIETSSRF